MPFRFQPLSLAGAVRIEPRLFSDERGYFLETYQRAAFRAAGIQDEFVQDNRSRSAKHVLRGLHFQHEPFAQGKLVHVVHGEAWDVIVDIRRGSPSFGKWEAVVLSEENRRMVYVPPGFAHGFIAMADGTELLYKVTADYAPSRDAGVVWNDPDLGIAWPVENPILSSKDRALPRFRDVVL
ncbi:MAG: dTDP-4-dehydrorhamnose 3,5-epimerase [Planctomycetota bacterium]